jgi:hypothetical protein
LFGKNLSKSITTFLAPGSILASFVVALLIFFSQVSTNQSVTVPLFSWFQVGDFPGRLFFSG